MILQNKTKQKKSGKKRYNFAAFSPFELKYFLKIKSCFVYPFKYIFSVFKQHYIYLYTFFSLTNIYTHIFKHMFSIFKCMYQTSLIIFSTCLLVKYCQTCKIFSVDLKIFYKKIIKFLTFKILIKNRFPKTYCEFSFPI